MRALKGFGIIAIIVAIIYIVGAVGIFTLAFTHKALASINKAAVIHGAHH